MKNQKSNLLFKFNFFFKRCKKLLITFSIILTENETNNKKNSINDYQKDL